jgi:hypothetical protein
MPRRQLRAFASGERFVKLELEVLNVFFAPDRGGLKSEEGGFPVVDFSAVLLEFAFVGEVQVRGGGGVGAWEVFAESAGLGG